MTTQATGIEPKITHTVVVVDPDMARRFLSLNDRNRNVRETRVVKYREDMESGRWTFAGDPIRFDATGKLVDGQHRLMALADSNVSGIPFLIIRGLPVEAQTVMDQGAKRTAADQLSMRGIKNSAPLAAAVKFFVIWERGLMFRDNRVAGVEISAPLIQEWCHQHSIEVDHFQHSYPHIRDSFNRIMISGSAFFIFERIDPAAAALFFRLLATGAGTEGHPINALDRYLRRIERQKIKVPERDLLAKFIQSWNAWRGGNTMTRFASPRGGNWTPETFPVAR